MDIIVAKLVQPHATIRSQAKQTDGFEVYLWQIVANRVKTRFLFNLINQIQSQKPHKTSDSK